MPQPRDSQGRFASKGWAPVIGLGLVIAAGSGVAAGAGGAGTTSAALTSTDASAARVAANRGLVPRKVFKALNPVIRAGRLTLRVHRAEIVLHGGKRRRALQVRVEVVNQDKVTVVLRGRDQVLVTYDQRKDSRPEETTAEDVTLVLRPRGRGTVTLTFVPRVGEAPASMRLRVGQITRTVHLRPAGQ